MNVVSVDWRSKVAKFGTQYTLGVSIRIKRLRHECQLSNIHFRPNKLPDPIRRLLVLLAPQPLHWLAI